jgi:hypothetical protein
MIDLNECEPGDELRLRNGEIATYVCRNTWACYPHDVEISGRPDVTLDNGRVCVHSENPYDVIEIIKKMKPYETKNGKGCVGEKRVDLFKIKVDCLKKPSLYLAIAESFETLDVTDGNGYMSDYSMHYVNRFKRLDASFNMASVSLRERHEISLDDFFRLTKDDVCFGEEPQKPEVREIDVEDIKKQFGITGEFKIKGIE